MVDLEVLKIALSKEEDAIETYQEILSQHPNLTELLSLLITEEQKHKILIEKKIVELTRS
ncbi:MAG: ferritin family protein [Candidatus Omnitrophica bacterium]|jgi:rubrerythrin|nr:ferritin family protein [Candidatus Omnitrophota bacterium]MDD5691429.1 ferritin family protein [Candidatus Omnitrophota bacterium]